MNRFVIFSLLLLVLPGCASIYGNATQDVTFVTPGAHDSICYIDNGETKYRAWPPQTIRMSKRSGDLEVRCVADGNREKTVTIGQETEPMALANFGNGFVPGMFVDSQTGALYTYPDTITVDFTDIPAQLMARPNYDKHIRDNPDLFGMEEFRPGRAALIRDKYATTTPLEKREFLTTSEFSTIEETAAPALETGAEGVTTTGGDPTNDLVSDLTRKMNPQVFGPGSANSASTDSDFIGGATNNSSETGASGGGEADTGPVTLYPLEEE